jgi:hypothetical protein
MLSMRVKALGPWSQWEQSLVEIELPGGDVVLRPLVSASSAADDAASTAAERDAEDVPAARAILPPRCWIVAAGDPYPEQLDATENLRRLALLDVELARRGIVAHPALGRSEDHAAAEASRALVATDRATVLDIAARFGQLAVFEIDERIACVATDDGEVVTLRSFTVAWRSARKSVHH